MGCWVLLHPECKRKNMNTEMVISNSVVEIKKSILGQANDLAREHEQLDLHIAVGRQMLYELLGKMYALTLELDASNDRELIMRQMRVELANKWGIKTQENTSDATALVRYITRADRKTAHVYARVIEVAKANQVKAPHLNGFIERQGGIEKIRSNNVIASASDDTVEETAKERLLLTREYIEARKESPYSSFKICNKLNDLSQPDALNFFVCSEKDGRYYVLAKLPVTEDQSRDLIERFGDKLCIDLEKARKDIARFSKKTHQKQSRRIGKGLKRRFPGLMTKHGVKKSRLPLIIDIDLLGD
jgi:hypothetical protein